MDVIKNFWQAKWRKTGTRDWIFSALYSGTVNNWSYLLNNNAVASFHMPARAFIIGASQLQASVRNSASMLDGTLIRRALLHTLLWTGNNKNSKIYFWLGCSVNCQFQIVNCQNLNLAPKSQQTTDRAMVIHNFFPASSIRDIFLVKMLVVAFSSCWVEKLSSPSHLLNKQFFHQKRVFPDQHPWSLIYYLCLPPKYWELRTGLLEIVTG